VNEQERKLRHVWATEPDIAKKLIVPGDDIHRALRAFCESEPVEGGDVELLRVTLDSTRRQLDQTTELLKAQGITLAAVEKERAKMGDENIAIKCDRDWLKGQLDLLRAKLAAAEKERDEAKREAGAMRDLAMRNANELNAAQRSYRAQIGELTRALAEEKKAHNEALRPDEYTRAAVACAEALADARVSYSDFEPIRERWQEIYTARQRGEPSAPVSSQPPARVLETWAAERMDGMTVGFDSAERALRCTGVIRAHRVALPVLKTVERGA
jgi:hypothetical protein